MYDATVATSPKIFGDRTTSFRYVPENFQVRNYVILLCPRIFIYILLFLSLFAHKRPSPFFLTYPTKNPLLNR